MAGTFVTSAQSLQKPTVPEPSLKIIKTHKTRYGTGAGYMGLFDWNVSGGYISKDLTQTGMATPSLSASGGYAMFHLQESVLSNYFLAKKYKRNKRVKIGLQNTFDFGMGMGSAARRSGSSTSGSDFAFLSRPCRAPAANDVLACSLLPWGCGLRR